MSWSSSAVKIREETRSFLFSACSTTPSQTLRNRGQGLTDGWENVMCVKKKQTMQALECISNGRNELPVDVVAV